MKHLLTALALLLSGGAAFAQTAPVAPTEVAVNPIECWWKTDRSAIRVGERFQLTLTCAVLDTDRVKVVVDESSLAPSALHLVPFEIVTGQRFRDIVNSPRRFFQYQYSMRLLGEDFFDKQVFLPRLQLSYRVQNTLNGGSAVAGREALYSLLPVPIRVLSMVPGGAANIRDTPPDTFGDVDARIFRSNALLIGAAVVLTLALLLIAVVLVRATVKRRARAAVRRRTVSPAFVLRAASRELAAVKSLSQQDGWTGDLAGRAATALRLAGAVALRKPVGEHDAVRGTEAAEGQIATKRGWRGKTIVLSSAVTAATRNGAPSPMWEGISQSLGTFSALRYSRPSTGSGQAGIDATALDAALAEAQDQVRKLRLRRLVSMGKRPPRAAEHTKPTWAR
ncbi:MAG TPA: hypothetical protein VL243_10455 [Vicinamibacterales bacterium]|nr:hypothetical protein [Vicinamibacterales bacterium]